MSLPNYLAKIKSAGVYRYVFDKSDIPEPERDSIRLVVGYSEKGPFNTPVYIEDSTDFIRTFGNISRRMERKGIFFHRMALQCLEAGPIVCLNLKPFNGDEQNREKANIYAFNASDIKLEPSNPITANIPSGTYNFASSNVIIKLTDTGKNVNSMIMAGGPRRVPITTEGLQSVLNGFVQRGQLSGDAVTTIVDTFDVIDDNEKNVGTAMDIIVPNVGETDPDTGELTPASEQQINDIFGEVVTNAVNNAPPVQGPSVGEDTTRTLKYSMNGGQPTEYSANGINISNDLGNGPVTITAWVENSSGELKTPKTTFTYTNASAADGIKLPKAIGFVATSATTGEPIDLATNGLEFNPAILDVLNLGSNASSLSLELYSNNTLLKEKKKSELSGSKILTTAEVKALFPADSDTTTVTLVAHFTMPGAADGPDNSITLTKGADGKITINGAVSEETAIQNMHAVEAWAYLAAREDGEHSLISIYDTNRFWKVDAERIHEIESISPGLGIAEKDYMRIVHTGSEDDSCTVFIRPYVPSNWNVKISDWYASEVVDEMPPYLEPIKDHYLSEFFVEIYVFKGNLNREGLYNDTGTLGSYKPFAEEGEEAWQPFCTIENGKLYTNANFHNAYNELADALDAMSEATTSGFVNRYVGITFPSFKDGGGNFIDIASVFNRDHQEHKMLLAMNEELLDEAYDYDIDGNEEYDDGQAPQVHNTNAQTVTNFIHDLCSPIVVGNHDLNSLDDEVRFDPAGKAIEGLYIKGYKYNSIKRSDKGEALQKKIMAVLSYKGMFEALTNNIDIDYKYIIDTFQTYPGTAMKSQLSYIAQKKFNCLAILNFPTIRSILDYCGWKNYKGGFDMKAILKKGGVTMPSEVQGASWSAFYTQLQMTDGAVKFVVPSAALVSNLFMEKRAKRLPYYIVAGPNYGRIDANDVVGPDYNYARADLDILEPFGVNTIIHIPRQGIVINGNQTAKQTPVTSLSKVHVRELVTFLQDELERMLLGYQWELNTATLRDMVRSKAEVILGLCLANGGIYDFKVTCDDSNNTPEVINNNMLVLDVDIIAAKGTEKIVQTLTLHRIGTNLQIV